MTVQTASEMNIEPKVLLVGWEEYSALVDTLISKVSEDGFVPDFIIGVAHGGIIPSVMIFKAFETGGSTHGIISVAEKQEGHHGILNVVTGTPMAAKPVRGNILLVDDFTQQGTTLNCCKTWIWTQLRCHIIHTAVLWHKTSSSFCPDFIGQVIEPDSRGIYPWIRQPFERT